MTTAIGTQIDLFAWTRDLERENKRIAKINEERARRRGYLVFATNPTISPTSRATARSTPPRRGPPIRQRPRSGRSRQGAACTRTSRPASTRTSWQTLAGWRR